MINVLLLSFGLLDNVWGDVILSANHILNRVPHKNLNFTSYELWKGYVPNLKYLRVWECLAKVGLLAFKKNTIGSKIVEVVFVGYALNIIVYRFMSSYDHSICESRDVFFENVFLTYRHKIYTALTIYNSSSYTISSKWSCKLRRIC